MCVYVAWIRILFIFFFPLHFYKYKNTTLWEKNKEDEEKAKCVTKDRTAATQSFGKVLVHQVIQYIYIYIHIHCAECCADVV